MPGSCPSFDGSLAEGPVVMSSLPFLTPRSVQSPDPIPGRRTRLLAALVLVVSALALWPCFIGLSRLRIVNDVDHWLPEDDPGLRQLKWYHAHFPPEDRVVISWRGSSLTDERLEEVARRLGTDNPFVESVIDPRDLVARITERNVTEEDALQRLRGLMIDRAGLGGPVSMLATLSARGSREAGAAVESIREATRAAGVPPDDLVLGGSPVARSQLDLQVGQTAWNPSAPLWWLPGRSPLLASVVVGLLICVTLCGGIRMTMKLVAVSIYGVMLSLAVVGLTGGHIDLVTTIMPALLFVLALSGAVHLVNYWHPEDAASPEEAVVTAIRKAWLPCVLASLTTAIGLWSLGTSPLIPVKTFGFYSGIGCLLILVAALALLPALLLIFRQPANAATQSRRSRWESIGRWLAHRPGLVSGVILFTMVVSGLGLSKLKTETKIIRYFPDTSRIIQDYEFLEREVSGIVPIEVVVRFDAAARESSHFADRMERVVEVQRLIDRHTDVSGSLSLADFRPSGARPGQDSSALQRIRYFKTADEFRRRLEEGDYPESRSFFQIVDRDDEYSRQGDEIWRITAQVNVLSDLDYATFITDVTNEAGTALGGFDGASAIVTGHVPLFLRTQQAVLESLIVSFLVTMVVIAAIFLFLLRSVSGTIAAMLPNLFPIAIVFGGFSWFGGVVDLGTMMTASIGLGIAVDGTLHLMAGFSKGIRAGLTHREAAIQSLGRSGEPLWQTAFMTAAGLGMLLFADLLLVSRFGWMMAGMLVTAWIGDVFLLTSLLAGPLGAKLATRIRTGSPLI